MFSLYNRVHLLSFAHLLSVLLLSESFVWPKKKSWLKKNKLVMDNSESEHRSWRRFH